MAENATDGIVETPAPAQQAPEKTLTQSEVNELIGRVKSQERARVAQVQPVQSSMGGMQQLSPDEIKEMIREETGKAAQMMAAHQNAHRVAQDFAGKIIAARNTHPDLEQKLNNVDLEKMADVIALANNTDNTADVMKDLLDNPTKISTFMGLYRDGLGHLAPLEMAKLSHSIKTNQKGMAQPKPPAPLGQIEHSAIGTDDSPMTIDDYRAADWLRG